MVTLFLKAIDLSKGHSFQINVLFICFNLNLNVDKRHLKFINPCFVFTTPSLSGRWLTTLKQFLPHREDGRPDSRTAERIGYFQVATGTKAIQVDWDSNPGL